MCGDKFLRYSTDSAQPEPLHLSDLESEDGLGAEFKLLMAPEGLVVGSTERALVAQQHGLAEGGQHQLLWDE